jgi:rare lipoprotein A
MTTPSRILGLLLGITLANAPLAQTPPAAPEAPATPPPASSPPSAGDTMSGLAAVYSDKLAGHKTASGEIFSQQKLTAAHPSLPFGTKVNVTNTNNNKTVEVRINDRGPKQAGRVVDLSSAAAAKIGLGKKGTAPVKLEVVGKTG